MQYSQHHYIFFKRELNVVNINVQYYSVEKCFHQRKKYFLNNSRNSPLNLKFYFVETFYPICIKNCFAWRNPSFSVSSPSEIFYHSESLIDCNLINNNTNLQFSCHNFTIFCFSNTSPTTPKIIYKTILSNNESNNSILLTNVLVSSTCKSVK